MISNYYCSGYVRAQTFTKNLFWKDTLGIFFLQLLVQHSSKNILANVRVKRLGGARRQDLRDGI
jgi:hypothetical protein